MNDNLKLLMTQTVQFFVVVLIYGTSSDSWFQDTTKDTIVIVTTYLIFLFIPWFSRFLNPIKIVINQENRLGNGIGVTPLLIENNLIQTPQTQRTVNLSIKITRKKSIWWYILIFLFKDKEIKVMVESSPGDLMIQAIDCQLANEIRVTERGYSIGLNELIINLNQRRGDFTIEKTFPYFVVNHPGVSVPYNLTAVIQPRILVNNKNSKFFNLLVKFDTDNHKVGFYRR